MLRKKWLAQITSSNRCGIGVSQTSTEFERPARAERRLKIASRWASQEIYIPEENYFREAAHMVDITLLPYNELVLREYSLKSNQARMANFKVIDLAVRWAHKRRKIDSLAVTMFKEMDTNLIYVLLIHYNLTLYIHVIQCPKPINLMRPLVSVNRTLFSQRDYT